MDDLATETSTSSLRLLAIRAAVHIQFMGPIWLLALPATSGR